MEQFTTEELQAVHSLCESRVMMDQFIKGVVPGINIMADLASTTALSEKVNRLIREKIEKEREEAAKKKAESKEG